MMATHYTWMVSGVQVLAGLLMLANRYVPLALVLLAAELVWFILAWPLRRHFAPLFVPRA